MTLYRCEFQSCTEKRKTFQTSDALEKHYDVSHGHESFPLNSASKHEHARPSKRRRRRNDITADVPSAKNNDDSEPNELHPVLHRLIKTHHKPRFNAEMQTENIPVPKSRGTLSKLERMMARFGFDVDLSNSQYKRYKIVEIVEYALAADPKTTIQAKTMEKVKSILKSEADPCSLLEFETHRINLSIIPDFPHKREEEFIKGVGGTLQLVYRNIHDVSMHLFGHPSFWKTMILYPSLCS
ncbi:hypothetical protein BJV82DRAFT_675954 [Fennellomyces sp. T-0311]|nr:hypothetical protein BJV82DRAFT_675954 [Fennellomyces sp. T-0311]